MKIAIGTDHRGFHMKLLLKEQLRTFKEQPIEWLDAGCFTAQRCDYPEFAVKVCQEVLKGTADCGVLICGSGVGMSIAANRFSGIYAALVWHEETAKLAKEHDGANVLVLPSDFVSTHDALAMVRAWLNASFLGGRYQARLTMIDSRET